MHTEPWYGNDPSWYELFDSDAFAAFGKHLTVTLTSKILSLGDPAAARLSCGRTVPSGQLAFRYAEEPLRIYRHDGIDVQGRIVRAPVTVVFKPTRWYPGDDRILDGREFPSVYVDHGDGVHRFADGALCLYYPRDMAQRRWTSEKGLRALISLAADHLFFEDVYRDTGEWIAPQAEHGFPAKRRRAA